MRRCCERVFGATAGFAMLAVAGIADAQQEGWYAGAAVGVTKADVSQSLWRDGPALSDTKLDNLSYGWQLYGGYRLHRHLGLEVGAHGYGETVFTARSTGIDTIWNQGVAEGRTEIRGMSMAVVAWFPGDERSLQYYGKAGILFFDTVAKYDSTINDINRLNDDGGLPLFALGLQRRIWGRWSARAEWQFTQTTIAGRDTVGIHFLSLGLMHPLP